MSTYAQSIQLLFGLERLGMKFGLEGVTRLLKELNNPHKKFPSIHIAGTNGKGSTASMLAAMLSAAGYKTGLYTSPHLISFEERIRISGKPISRASVARLTDRLKRLIVKNNPTFFEATTAIAFAHFAEEEVDIAVIETGLGGRLDSTNVLNPVCSIVTNIGMEHTEILGDTLAKIAFEKAGIVKPGVPCITGIDDEEALTVLKKVCKKNKSRLVLGTQYRARINSADIHGTLVDFSVGRSVYKKLQFSLAGHHQLKNLAVSLTAVEVLNECSPFAVDEQAVRTGLGSVQKLTGLNGRLSVVYEHPFIIADVAHNSDAVRNLCEVWKRLKMKKPVLVFGVVKDKDYAAMIRQLAGITERVVAVAARTPRSRSASDIAATFEQAHCETRAALSVEAGLNLAIELAGTNGTVLITGSHFVVGEALEALHRKRA